MNNLRRQLRYQLKVFLLDKVNWILPVLSLILLFTDIGFKENNIYSPLYVVRLSRAIFLFTTIVFGALAARFFVMETSNDYQIQWSRQNFRRDYVLVKFLALFIGVTLSLFPALLILLIRGLPFNTIGGLIQGAGFWFYNFVPTFLFTTAFSILIGLLVPIQGLAMGISLAGLLGLALHQTSWPDLLSYVTQESFGLIFGFGPAREPLFFNRAFFLALSLALFLVTLLIAHFRLPSNKGKLSQKPIAVWSILFTLAAVGTAFLGSHLNYLGKHLVAKPDLAKLSGQKAFCDNLEGYSLDIVIDQQGHFESATATFQVQGTAYPKENILLLGSLKDTRFVLEELTPGKFRVEYNGQFISPNYSYDSGIQDPEIAMITSLPGAFMDHSKMLLLAHGQWHPFPKCDLERLSLTLPSEVKINYVSAQSQTRELENTVFYWEGSLPEVLMIAGGSYEKVQLNGNEALLPKHLDAETRKIYTSYESRITEFWKKIYGENSTTPQLVVLPVLRMSLIDNSGNFFLSWVPITKTLPGANPTKIEIEIALEIIQAWWAEGKADSTVRACMVNPLTCDFPTRFTPEDKSILPFLYFASIKFAADHNPEIVDLDEIISQYQSIHTDPSVVFNLPRYFTNSADDELLVKLAEFDRCIGGDAFWAILQKVRDSSESVWMDYTELTSAIESISGMELDNLEGQCSPR